MTTVYGGATADERPVRHVDSGHAAGLYAQLLGPSWWQLAEPIRLAHSAKSTACARGRLRITHGRGRVARFLAALLGLPRASTAAETQLLVTSCSGVEHWRRIFDDRCLASRQYAIGTCELGERFGVLEFRFRLDVSDGCLVFQQVDAAVVVGFVRVGLPPAWAPKIDAREDPAGPRQVAVHVRVVVPGVGPLLTYDGNVDLEGPRE